MLKTPSKGQAKEKIEEFFSDINGKTPKDIRKIKKLVMRHNIKLGELRKKFCKKCFTPYKNPKIRIKGGIKSVTCENCGYKSRWKIKNMY